MCSVVCVSGCRQGNVCCLYLCEMCIDDVLVCGWKCTDVNHVSLMKHLMSASVYGQIFSMSFPRYSGLYNIHSETVCSVVREDWWLLIC